MKIVTAAAVQKAIGKPSGMAMEMEWRKGTGERNRGMGKTVGNLQAHMYRSCGLPTADWVAAGLKGQ